MIRNPSTVRSLEHELSRKEPADYRRNLRIFEALYSEAHHHGGAAPSEIVREIDPIVERVILRCLAGDPRQRSTSAAQVAAAAESWREMRVNIMEFS